MIGVLPLFYLTLIYIYISEVIELMISDTVRIDSGREGYVDVIFMAHPDWKDKGKLGAKCSVTESKSFECKDIAVGDKADEIRVKVMLL